MKIQLRWGSEMKESQESGARSQKSEHRTQNTEHRAQSTLQTTGGQAEHRQRKTSLLSFVWLLASGFWLLYFIGCAATTAKLPPPSPEYIYEGEKIESQTQNSLWRDTASLFGDRKGWRLNDLVTIRIVEKISGSKKAGTSTKKDSSVNAGVNAFLGAPLNSGEESFWGKPEINASVKNNFKGAGETTREGKLVGTVTARVIKVMPNNNLVLEGRKETTINNEKQILIIKGMARPDDINADNTILSSKMADTEIYFVGAGIIQDKQKPGWLVRIVDKIWPF